MVGIDRLIEGDEEEQRRNVQRNEIETATCRSTTNSKNTSLQHRREVHQGMDKIDESNL